MHTRPSALLLERMRMRYGGTGGSQCARADSSSLFSVLCRCDVRRATPTRVMTVIFDEDWNFNQADVGNVVVFGCYLA